MIVTKGPAYHKSGVLLWGLGARNQAQLSLFENTAKSQRDHQLDHALDCLKKRYGKDCIQTATISQYPHYAMKQNLRSPRFTTVGKNYYLLNKGLEELDSNQRRINSADLQSAAIDRSAIPPSACTKVQIQGTFFGFLVI